MIDSTNIQKSSNKEVKADSSINTNHQGQEKILLLSENCNSDVITDSGLGHIYGSW